MSGDRRPKDLPPLTPEEVVGRIECAIGPLAGRHLVVAFSGGPDSTALLHLVADARATHGFAMRALHVEHGLHEDSAHWAQVCRAECERLDCPIRILPVTVRPGGLGIESAARRARVEALAGALAPGEILLTAQHLEDQAETVLHGLLRGSGRAGLRGMASAAPLGVGRLVRPLLDVPRARLVSVCQQRRLPAIDDPSNRDPRLARGFLRTRVWPVLLERWPGAVATIARTARLATEEQALLDALAADDLAGCDVREPEPFALAISRVDATRLAALGDARARNALRYWFRRQAVRSPQRARLEQVVGSLLRGRPSGSVSWDQVTLYRYRDALYLAPGVLPSTPGHGDIESRAWSLDGPLDIPQLSLRLVAEPVVGSGIRRSFVSGGVSVRSRLGGERVRVPGGAHRRYLKKLYQEIGVPPWARWRLPVLWVDHTPICVPGVAVFDGAAATGTEEGIEIRIVDMARHGPGAWSPGSGLDRPSSHG